MLCYPRLVSSDVYVFGGPPEWTLEGLAQVLRPHLEAAGVVRAVAFGSYARGTADRESDLDLAVVLPTDRRRTERGPLVRDLVLACPVALDVLVFTPEEFESGLGRDMDVFHRIRREGVDVFRRPEG